MALNIKSPEADQLVQNLSEITGESKTQAVIEALRERLERVRRERNQQTLAADLLAIGQRCAAHDRRNLTGHDDWLYDERGLPR